MKAFAYLTAVVLVVIGIGIGLVGGTPYLLPPSRTYGSGSLAFAVRFPTLEGGRVRVLRYPASPSNRSGWGRLMYDVRVWGPDPYGASVNVLQLDTVEGSAYARVLEGTIASRFTMSTVLRDGVAMMIGHPTCAFNIYLSQDSVACRSVELFKTGSNVLWVVQGYSSSSIPQVAGAFVSSFQLPSWGDARSGVAT
jgi:hypothetical protein